MEGGAFRVEENASSVPARNTRDVQRATINWNLALRLDPEYTDVRNILKALHENKLKSENLEGE